MNGLAPASSRPFASRLLLAFVLFAVAASPALAREWYCYREAIGSNNCDMEAVYDYESDSTHWSTICDDGWSSGTMNGNQVPAICG